MPATKKWRGAGGRISALAAAGLALEKDGMQKVFGLLLVIAGGALIYQGFARRDSLVGGVAAVTAQVANRVDGGSRVPEHVYYLSGGLVLVVAGATLALRKSG